MTAAPQSLRRCGNSSIGVQSMTPSADPPDIPIRRARRTRRRVHPRVQKPPQHPRPEPATARRGLRRRPKPTANAGPWNGSTDSSTSATGWSRCPTTSSASPASATSTCGRPACGRVDRGDGRLLRARRPSRRTSTLTTYLPADLPHVALDADLFKQALLNLMLNAEQAMPQGGELIVQACGENGGVRLDLIDTGVGMTAEQTRRRCSARSSRRSRAAPGWACRRRGGSWRPTAARSAVESEPGRGTKFTVRLAGVIG